MRLWWWWGYDIGIISYIGRFVWHVELCCYRAASSVQTVVWSRWKVETNDGVTRRHKLRGELERRGGVNPKREKPETRSQEKTSSRESTKSIIDFWYTVYPICTCSYYLFGGKRWSIVIYKRDYVQCSVAQHSSENQTANIVVGDRLDIQSAHQLPHLPLGDQLSLVCFTLSLSRAVPGFYIHSDGLHWYSITAYTLSRF